MSNDVVASRLGLLLLSLIAFRSIFLRLYNSIAWLLDLSVGSRKNSSFSEILLHHVIAPPAHRYAHQRSPTNTDTPRIYRGKYGTKVLQGSHSVILIHKLLLPRKRKGEPCLTLKGRRRLAPELPLFYNPAHTPYFGMQL